MITALKQGDLLDGRYQLRDELGRGPFSRVFKATQIELDRDVVIKFLTAKDSETRVRARFRREARLLSQLNHPNTLVLYDFGWSKTEQAFLVTEHVPGVTLWKVLKHHGALEPARAVEIIRQVLYSLREAHSKDIIHRDMKPDNVMLYDTAHERDRVKVLDFGIAKFADNTLRTRSKSTDKAVAEEDLDANDPNVTLNGRLVGTPRYMAPEFLAGEEATPASDLYAVGLVFFEMLTGRRAVPGKTPSQIIARQLSPAPVLPDGDESIPEPLREVVRLATHKDASARLKSCKAFLKHLDKIKLDAPSQSDESVDEDGDNEAADQPSLVSLYSIAADIVAADGLSESGWPSQDLGSVLQPIKLRGPRTKLGKALGARKKKSKEAKKKKPARLRLDKNKFTKKKPKKGSPEEIKLEEIKLEAPNPEDLSLEDLSLEGLSPPDISLEELSPSEVSLEELSPEDVSLEEIAPEIDEVESLFKKKAEEDNPEEPDDNEDEPEKPPVALLFDPSARASEPAVDEPEEAPSEKPDEEEEPPEEAEQEDADEEEQADDESDGEEEGEESDGDVEEEDADEENDDVEEEDDDETDEDGDEEIDEDEESFDEEDLEDDFDDVDYGKLEEEDEEDEDEEEDEAAAAFEPIVVMPKPSFRSPKPVEFDVPRDKPRPVAFYATIVILLLALIFAFVLWQGDKGDTKPGNDSPTPPRISEKPSPGPSEASPAPKAEIAEVPEKAPEEIPKEVVEAPKEIPKEVVEAPPVKEDPPPVEEEKVATERQVQINTEPTWAYLKKNGRVQGKTPMAIVVQEGDRAKWTVSRAGFAPVTLKDSDLSRDTLDLELKAKVRPRVAPGKKKPAKKKPAEKTTKKSDRFFAF